MDKLRTAFQEIVDPALYTPERHYSIETPGVGSNVLQGVRFTLRGLSTQRGSITLISILGAVYVGAKDYETLRKSLLVLADDIRRMLARVIEVPAWWDIDRDIIQGQAQATASRSSTATGGAAPNREAFTPVPAAQNGGLNSAVGSGRWDTRLVFTVVFTGYIVLTNILLMVLFWGALDWSFTLG